MENSVIISCCFKYYKACNDNAVQVTLTTKVTAMSIDNKLI